MTTTKTPKPKRPTCPNCGRELVFAAIVAGGLVFHTWICDCADQPYPIGRDIVLAREWDEKALVFELEVERDE